jgi:uncharacterized repeat protein (TIGR03803 family)
LTLIKLTLQHAQRAPIKARNKGDLMKRQYLWGSALAIALLASTSALAQTTPTFTTLHAFVDPSGSNNITDGAFPFAGLISAASGAFYGTTPLGGHSNEGTVFELLPPATAGGAWTETVLYSFKGSGVIPGQQVIGNDGALPYGGLIADASGALYGVTVNGGVYGYGAVYKVTPPALAGGAWTETVLYSFSGGGDGGYPYGALASDASGAVYGTTSMGGTSNYGTVFQLTPPTVAGGTWTEAVLHSFSFTDGAYPYTGLTSDASGALYGTTIDGGTLAGGAYGAGIVFQLRPPALAGGNWTETVLHVFTEAGGDGGRPVYAGLALDASGAVYGTTDVATSGPGIVYKLTPPAVAGGNWTETVLYSFTGGSDEGDPQAGVILDAAGNVYGTTEGGSATQLGTIFKLAPPATAGGAWTETVLHTFTGSDGALPMAGLVADASGALYGMTQEGGSGGAGTAFQLTLPATFTGVPGQANCTGQSIAFMAKKYGGIAAAAKALGYASVTALQNAVLAYCGG